MSIRKLEIQRRHLCIADARSLQGTKPWWAILALDISTGTQTDASSVNLSTLAIDVGSPFELDLAYFSNEQIHVNIRYNSRHNSVLRRAYNAILLSFLLINIIHHAAAH